MFLTTDVGCYADGGFGHAHVRSVLARLLERMHRHHPRGGDGLHWAEVKPIVEALDADMSDDAWEEYEAIEWLNRDCEDGCHFTFDDGDLMLVGDDWSNTTARPSDAEQARREHECRHDEIETLLSSEGFFSHHCAECGVEVSEYGEVVS